MLPAYAGLISSMALGFLMQTTYLLPLTVASLALALAALGFRAKRRQGYGPLAAGLVAAGAFVLGKFDLGSNLAVCGGLAGLIGASVWSSWPKKSAPSAPTETLLQLGSIKKES
jgi:hypothetical protein